MQVKVKFTLEQVMKTHRGSRGIAELFSLTSPLVGGGWSLPLPGSFTPMKDTLYPLYRRPGGQRLVWTGAENLASPTPLGIQSPTVRPTVSHYIDYIIPAHVCLLACAIKHLLKNTSCEYSCDNRPFVGEGTGGSIFIKKLCPGFRSSRIWHCIGGW
jgi:hypothetical protein